MTREQLLFWLCALLFVAGGLLGGGPTDPILSMIVELIACSVLGVALIGLLNGEAPRSVWPAVGLLALIALLPLVQLIPLPASTWRTLPGHANLGTILQLIGQGDNARPLSLSPEDTRMRALALIVPIAMFLGVTQLDPPARDRIAMLIVGFALVSAVVGVFQVASGQLYFYSYTHLGYPVGFFANRNHEADLQLIAMPLVARVIATRQLRSRTRRNVTLAAVAFFAVSAVATQSRTGVALLPGAILGTYVTYTGRLGGRHFWIVLGSLLLVSALAGLLLLFTPFGQHLLLRFSQIDQNLRPAFWSSTMAGIHQFWPFGSGVGSFVPVYKMFEDLNFVTDEWVNHAHNGYLEILLETGLAGAILLVLYALLLVGRLFAAAPEWLTQHKWMAMTGIAILLLHSTTDYPLNTFGLLAAFAFLNALLYPSRRSARVRRRTGRHPVEPPPPAFAEPMPTPV